MSYAESEDSFAQEAKKTKPEKLSKRNDASNRGNEHNRAGNDTGKRINTQSKY